MTDYRICDHVTLKDVIRAAMQGFDVAHPDCGPECTGGGIEDARTLWATGLITPEQARTLIQRPMEAQ